jgi:hypothetical protein
MLVIYVTNERRERPFSTLLVVERVLSSNIGKQSFQIRPIAGIYKLLPDT